MKIFLPADVVMKQATSTIKTIEEKRDFRLEQLIKLDITKAKKYDKSFLCKIGIKKKFNKKTEFENIELRKNGYFYDDHCAYRYRQQLSAMEQDLTVLKNLIKLIKTNPDLEQIELHNNDVVLLYMFEDII